MNRPLHVLFEDEHVLGLAKPAGQFPLGVWAPEGETTVEADVRVHLDAAHPGAVYVGVVHRLDRVTSGVLLWAKHPKAARRLSRQFENRTVRKEYWAIVERGFSARFDPRWEDWLTDAHKEGVARVVSPGAERARQAVTRAALEHANAIPSGLAWLRLWPETGRTHQLRAGASSRGMPIVGDHAYGSTRPFAPPGAIALHAHTLEVRHPISGMPLALRAPVPQSWAEAGILLRDPDPEPHATPR